MRTGAGASVRSQPVPSCTAPPPGRRTLVGPRPLSATGHRRWQSVAMTCPAGAGQDRRRRARRAVESRTTSSAGSSAGRTWGGVRDDIPASSVCTAYLPRAASGAATVVRAGEQSSAPKMLSKPDDADVPRHAHAESPRARASGRSRRGRCTPTTAVTFEAATTGRGLRAPRERRRERAEPLHPQVEHLRRLAHRPPAHPVRPRRLRPGDVADVPVLELDARCSIARRAPRALSVMTLGIPVSTRLSTTVGRCWAITRIAESDMREVAEHDPLDERQRAVERLALGRRRLVHVRDQQRCSPPRSPPAPRRG